MERSLTRNELATTQRWIWTDSACVHNLSTKKSDWLHLWDHQDTGAGITLQVCVYWLCPVFLFIIPCIPINKRPLAPATHLLNTNAFWELFGCKPMIVINCNYCVGMTLKYLNVLACMCLHMCIGFIQVCSTYSDACWNTRIWPKSITQRGLNYIITCICIFFGVLLNVFALLCFGMAISLKYWLLPKMIWHLYWKCVPHKIQCICQYTNIYVYQLNLVIYCQYIQ